MRNFQVGLAFRRPASGDARNFYRPLMWGLSNADAVVEHVVFHRCRIVVYGLLRAHVYNACTSRFGNRDVPRITFPCCNRAQHGTVRSTVRFMAAHVMPRWARANRKWVRAEQHGALIPTIPPAALLPRANCGVEWSLMLRYRRKKPLLSFLLFLSLFFTRDTFILFPNAGTGQPRCFSRTMEQYLVPWKWKYI